MNSNCDMFVKNLLLFSSLISGYDGQVGRCFVSNRGTSTMQGFEETEKTFLIYEEKSQTYRIPEINETCCVRRNLANVLRKGMPVACVCFDKNVHRQVVVTVHECIDIQLPNKDLMLYIRVNMHLS